MRARLFGLGLILQVCAIALVVAQSGEDLFREGGLKQNVDGDLAGAVQLYERVVREFPANRALVARALFQLAECYERLRQPEKSRENLQRIVDQFKDQPELVARAVSRLPAVSGAGKPVLIRAPYSDDPFSFALSPDSKSLVAWAQEAGRSQLWLYKLDGTAAPTLLPGTETARRCCWATPFWSPDGRQIGFSADGKLKVFDTATGTVRVLAPAPFFQGGTWNQDDLILFSPTLGQPLQLVSARTPQDGVITATPIGVYGRPHFLPDGRHFLHYYNVPAPLRVRSLDNTDVEPLPVTGVSSGIFVAPDRLVYVARGVLYSQRLNPTTLQLIGDAKPLADNVALFGPQTTASSASRDAVAYRTARNPLRQFVWWDRRGQQIGVVGAPDAQAPMGARFISEGTQVIAQPLGGVVGRLDLSTGETSVGAANCQYSAFFPVPSPDGKSVACANGQAAAGRNARNLFRVPLDGTPGVQMRPPTTGFNYPQDWSADGRFVLYFRFDVDETGSNELLVQPVDGGDPVRLTNTEGWEMEARFSPNQQWIAYSYYSPGAGYEIYVQAFPGTDSARRKISVNGGRMPEWSRDGKELYFISNDDHLMVVNVTFSADGKELTHTPPSPLFPTKLPVGTEYLPAPDGQRFLMNLPVGEFPPIYVLPIPDDGKQ